MKPADVLILDRLFDALGRALTPEVARALMKLRLNARIHARIDKLARKCNEGELTELERREYETVVDILDLIAILQSKSRRLLKRSTGA